MAQVPYPLKKRQADMIWKEATTKSYPSDIIRLTGESGEKIIELWWEDWERKRIQSKYKLGPIPSDIFFTENIPLLDSEIVIDEKDTDGEVISYRVVIFSDYKERIANKHASQFGFVGHVVISFGFDEHFLFPIVVLEGELSIEIGPVIFHCNNKNKYDFITSQPMDTSEIKTWFKFIAMCLQTWYGIQIALLHPTVKDVFKNPKQERVFNPASRSQPKNRKRVTRYIKKHVINAEDIEKAMSGGRGYNRQTLVWYVIGHWRTYKDGRKVFVKPCWKGPLRDLKRNLDDREREIVLA